MSKYYYGFRQTFPRPPGRWVSCGPFDTYDLAMSDRRRSKQWDCELTEVFEAASQQDAQGRLERDQSP